MNKTLRALIGGLISTALGILGVLVPVTTPANAAITTTYTGYGMHEVVRYVGHYKASTDGFSGGNTYGNITANGTGTIGALMPSPGATVVKAFLSSEGRGWDGSQVVEVPRPPVVSLNGQSVSFYGKNYATPWTNFLADVTPIVQGYFNSSPTGTAVSAPWSGTKYSLPLVYEAAQSPWGIPTYTDGLALTVIFEDTTMTSDASVVYYFGSSNTNGQLMSLNFDLLPALPNNGTYSGSWMSLGSGWSQGGSQYSSIKAQNNLQAASVGSPWTDISGSAGGCDDSHGPNGVSANTGCDSQYGLISVGGIGDSTANPTAIAQGQADDELYNLDGFLAAGVNRIDLSTRNPSGDDNLFQLVLSLPFVLKGTVAFDANGGTGTMANQTSLATAPLTTNTFARAGWAFTGWNTLADGSGTPYADEAAYSFNIDTTLYAQWSQSTRTITYDSQGGSAVHPGFYTGTITSFPAAPTWVGHTFNGWFAASTGGTALAAPYTPASFANITIYAQWTTLPKVVSYDSQGGSAVAAGSYTGTINSFPAAPTWANHAFNGWFAASAGGTALTAPYTPSSFVDVTIYAQWTVLTQPVTFDSQGGSVVAATTYTSTINALPAAPSRPGFNFNGWFVSSTGGTALTAPYTPSAFTAITLYAQWTAVPVAMIHYTASFDSQGGSNVASIDYFYGFDLPAKPTRDGYTCIGWYTDKSGGSPLAQHVELRPLGDLTLYAQWTKDEFTATFDTQGGSAVAPVTFADSVPLPAAPTRDGYRFIGWFTSPSGGSGLGAAYAPVKLADVTLFAQWSKFGSLVLWGFADGSAKPTAKMLASLKAYLKANTSFTKITCVGSTEGPTLLKGDTKLALARAANVCAATRAILGVDSTAVKLGAQNRLAVSAANRRVVIQFSDR